MASGKFITNKHKILADTIQNILPTTGSVDMLVGFFYFSGFDHLYNSLKDKKIRILVGMEVEIDLKNKIKEIYSNHQQNDYQDTKYNYIEQLKKAFNKTEVFDNEDTHESVNIFLSKIVDKTLEIRKTLEPNHSKLYLFHEIESSNQGGDRPGVLITGSSNFTYSGLEGRYELNARFDDKQSFVEGLQIFEELWNESIEITSGGENDPVVEALQKQTWLNLPTPYEAYIRVLSEYFETKENLFESPEILTDGKIKDLDYQIEAIKKGLNIVNEHSGVIIADVVGLGKSIIGSTLVANLGKRAIVITPPHLKKQWENYGEDFGLTLKIFSSGKIKEALEFSTKYKNYKVILIDEAHRYRTSENIDYGYLQQITIGKKVILLSATPFNNSPEDIFNLIKLFQIPKKSTLQTSRLLTFEFQELIREYDKIRTDEKNNKLTKPQLKEKLNQISAKIKSLIYPVVIRRSRVDLERREDFKKDLEKQGYSYSKVNKPKTIEFELGEIQDDYINTINILLDLKETHIKKKKFTCARYTPLLYLKDEYLRQGYYYDTFFNLYGYYITRVASRQENMPKFITRLMVARFESSLHSFKITLGNIIRNYENYENWIKIGKIPIIGRGILPNLVDLDFSEFEGEFIDDENKLNFEEIKKLSREEINTLLKNDDGFVIDLEHLEEDFVTNFHKDLGFLKNLQEIWSSINYDPKLTEFCNKLTNDIRKEPNRKIVVFSQFSDTVEKVYSYLIKNGLKVLKVTAGDKTKKTFQELMSNFDAGYDQIQKNDYDIVVATDAISEGYNLHRAGTVYNYDIPYNPTIVIQRVGRINRINKKIFEELNIFNFFPSLVGSPIVRTESIAKLKISMINFILGTDTRTLDEAEDLDSFYSNIIQEDESYNEEESWDTIYENELNKIKKYNKPLYIKSSNLPDRTRLRRENPPIQNHLPDHSVNQEGCIITFAKKGGVVLFKIIDTNTRQISTLTIQEAFEIFFATEDEKGFETSKNFYTFYNEIKKDLFKINTDTKKDPLITKTIDNLDRFQRDFPNEYYKLLRDCINKLGNVPDVYLTLIREITPNNKDQKISKLVDELKLESLQKYIDISNKFDTKAEEIIISEEF